MTVATEKEHTALISDERLRTIHHALQMLSTHLPEINIMFEENFDRVSEQLVDLSTRLDAYHTLSTAVKGNDDTHEQRTHLYDELRQTLSQSITDMQFQDRISQNIAITVNVAKTIASALESHIAPKGGLDETLTQQILEQMTLGEIKRKFLGYAESTGAMTNTADIPL